MKCLAALLLLAASVAVADIPAPPTPCRNDAECVISDFQGCCPDCCPSPPRAWSTVELARVQKRCEIIDCARREDCNIPCALPEKKALIAVCTRGVCVAREASRPSDPDFCASDSDCVSSTFNSCCGSCCPAAPVAVSRGRAQLQQQQCARVRCEPLACGNIACAQFVPSPIRPVCRANRCVAERPNVMPPPPPPPPAQCQVAADCGVDLNPPPGNACWSSPCGCCPTPRAVPIEQVRPPPVRRTPRGLHSGSHRETPRTRRRVGPAQRRQCRSRQAARAAGAFCRVGEPVGTLLVGRVRW
jgi:hypothetical protein